MSKVALITGCSSGLGLSLALKFAALPSYTVYATVRDVNKATDLVAKAKELQNLKVKTLDVSNEDSVRTCVDEIIKADAKVDVLVNNAGYSSLKTVEQSTMKELQDVMDVNFFGVVRTIKAVLPHMRKNGGGRIINISSIGGVLGMPFNDGYCAAKAALEGLSESMATTLRPLNIHVSLVEPGAITTNFTARVMTDFTASGGITSEDPYKGLFDRYVAAVTANYKASSSQSPDQVADYVVQEVVSVEEPHLRNFTSDLVRELASNKLKDLTGTAHLQAIRNKYLPQ